MADLVEANDIMFTPFEPKLKNRFIMEIDGIPAYMIKTSGRPQIYSWLFLKLHSHLQLFGHWAKIDHCYPPEPPHQ